MRLEKSERKTLHSKASSRRTASSGGSNRVSEQPEKSEQNPPSTDERRDEVSIDGPKKSDGSEFKKGFVGWVKSFVYLGVLWICGAAFTLLLMHILLARLTERPQYFGKGTHIGGTPQIIFEPNPNRFDVSTRSVIRFRPRDPKSYQNLMVRYKLVLKHEYNKTNSPTCASILGVLDGFPTNQSVCRVDTSNHTLFGPCALTLMNINRGMGFSRSKPCIMLRLTRILGWYPSDSEESSIYQCEAGQINCCNKKRILFTCNSKGSASLEMFPEEGISTCAFPFWNQIGYEQPYVMLRVSNLTTGMNEIECRPNLKSIQKLDDGSENIVRIFIDKVK